MTTSLLSDAFAHHVWATERLIDACTNLSSEQLSTPAPGTYGSIVDTLRHLVASDCWYLSFFRAETKQLDENAEVSLSQLRSLIRVNGAAWAELLAGALDPDADVVEEDDGWEVHSPAGVRLAQVVHHGTDHRSQVCTALTSLGITPPEIDVWAYARATGREQAVELPTR
jgi:uncharacterized damage-inducible protein DinB